MRPVVCAILLSVAVAHAGGTSQTAPARFSFDPGVIYKVPRGHGPAEGPADALLTVVDWSDYACGYCNRAQETLDRLDRLYPGQIRWVHRILPLDDDNTVAAEATLAAAAQGRFRPMHDRLYAVRGHVDRAAVEMIAQELGLDMIAFRAALDAGTYRPQVIEDIRDAQAIGVTGTPTFFINGHVVHGAAPLSVFAAVADQELARAFTIAAARPTDLYEAAIAQGHPSADAPADANNDAPELDANKAYRVGLGLPGHQLGPDHALVTIVEFSDFQCPYCAREAPVLAAVQKKYGDQVRVIYRHMGLHRNSLLAAEAAMAAAEQGKFWAFHDQVFANFGHLTRPDLDGFAKAAGLDMQKFGAALDDRRYHDAIVQETAAAEALGVDGTPTMFLNGQPISGALDQDHLEKILNAVLANAKTAVGHGIPALDLYAMVMIGAVGEERADPSTVPDASASIGGHLEMRSDDRVRAVGAACRRHDGKRAAGLSEKLSDVAKKRAADVCSEQGIDLP